MLHGRCFAILGRRFNYIC